MQITHEEAQRLIHRKSDQSLKSPFEAELNAHLSACETCRAYNEAIQESESVLRQTLKKQWNIRPLPLSMDVIYEKTNPTGMQRALLTTRTALISVAIFLFAFITWQSMAGSVMTTQQIPLGTLPLIPTPATYTATSIPQTDCSSVRYIVQAGDTVESIARQFSIEPASILLANNLTREPPALPRELLIPLCGATPAGTAHPSTLTITPSLETITTTPG